MVKKQPCWIGLLFDVVLHQWGRISAKRAGCVRFKTFRRSREIAVPCYARKMTQLPELPMAQRYSVRLLMPKTKSKAKNSALANQ
jgi:hypothetical protein